MLRPELSINFFVKNASENTLQLCREHKEVEARRGLKTSKRSAVCAALLQEGQMVLL